MKFLGQIPFFQGLVFLVVSFSILDGFAQAPLCTQLSMPADGDTDVSPTVDFEWEAAERATGYILIASTTQNGNDILNNVDVGNVTEYDLPENLPPSSTVYVAIIPINDSGANGSCSQVRFTTATSNGLPQCAVPTSPEHAAQNISVTPELTWSPVSDAGGYLLTIGTTTGAPPVLDKFDVGNVTSYISPSLAQNSTYYFAVTPYNTSGNAENCGVQSSFTTGGPSVEDPLPCTKLLFPQDGAAGLGPNVELRWEAVTDAEGYLVSVSTTTTGNDILNRLDVGGVTAFALAETLPPDTEIFVLIKPYGEGVEALNCQMSSFFTKVSNQEIPDNLVPRFFTPNHDGTNDSWSVPSQDGISVRYVSVFDRYGKLLLQLLPDQEWDGTLDGRNLPSGSYWYSVHVANAPVIKGYLLLKR